MTKPIESYKYQRKCSLSRCKKVFGTNRKDQIFCESAHRIEYHTQAKTDMRRLHHLMERLEDFRKLEKAFKKAFKKAVKAALDLTDLLTSIKGGENSIDKKREPNG